MADFLFTIFFGTMTSKFMKAVSTVVGRLLCYYPARAYVRPFKCRQLISFLPIDTYLKI